MNVEQVQQKIGERGTVKKLDKSPLERGRQFVGYNVFAKVELADATNEEAFKEVLEVLRDFFTPDAGYLFSTWEVRYNPFDKSLIVRGVHDKVEYWK